MKFASKLQIRLAPPELAETLTEITIAAKAHWNYPESWMQRWRPDLTISSEYIKANETWIAYVGARAAAYYSLHVDGADLWLDNLFVTPEFIGKGFGRKLLDHARRRARQRGFAQLKIEADPNAEGFYEKMGARKVGEHDRGEIDGQRRILPIMDLKT